MIVIGDGAEVMDTLYPFYRLAEDFQVVVSAPEKETYHLVIHQLKPGWDITEESEGYLLDSDTAFRDVKVGEYAAIVLPGGRAPEYLRYDADLLRIMKEFSTSNKPIASICHGVEILATADIIRGRKVTTIPKCRFDVEICGAEYVTDPVMRDGNLLCARGKKDMAEWMKIFVQMIKESLDKSG